LRQGPAGRPEYRELHVGGPLDKPQWMPIADKDTTPDGWRPAINFLQMDFTPPLGALPTSGSDYLAYRPVQTQTSASEIEVVPLNVNFGKTEGTFRWHGELYRYALAQTLPCFAPPKPQPQ
jgi:hypothetical protein